MDSKFSQFGFLPVASTIHFSGGALVLLDSYQEVADAVRAATNTDGFVYPPLEKRMRATQPKVRDGNVLPEEQWDWEEVPKTERPAHLHRLPPSHELRLEEPPFENDLRKHDGAFLMYLAGYLYGYRLQFHDWWFDGRVNMTSSHKINVRDEKAAEFLSKSYANWKAWSPDVRKHFTNILYMNSRSELYEWDWERFMIAYMVFDACYKHAKGMGEVEECSHSARLEAMCRRYGLHCDASLGREIVGLRNVLFHEALWDGGQPCSSGGQRSFDYTECLRGINHRLIPALLGYSTGYIGSRWDFLSTCGF
jgi:hypothetical protein